MKNKENIISEMICKYEKFEDFLNFMIDIHTSEILSGTEKNNYINALSFLNLCSVKKSVKKDEENE